MSQPDTREPGVDVIPLFDGPARGGGGQPLPATPAFAPPGCRRAPNAWLPRDGASPVVHRLRRRRRYNGPAPTWSG